MACDVSMKDKRKTLAPALQYTCYSHSVEVIHFFPFGSLLSGRFLSFPLFPLFSLCSLSFVVVVYLFILFSWHLEAIIMWVGNNQNAYQDFNQANQYAQNAQNSHRLRYVQIPALLLTLFYSGFKLISGPY